MKQKQSSVLSGVSHSHFSSLLCGVLGEKVKQGNRFIFCFERREARELQAEGGA